MKIKLYISVWWKLYALILATESHSDTNVQLVNDTIYHSLPASKETICNQVNPYKSFTTCTCDSTQVRKTKPYCPRKGLCPDRSHADDKLVCIPTSFHGGIFMRNECLSEYPADVIKNCQTTDENTLINDVLLNIPVTTTTRMTYRNLYCAICNNEEAFTFWNIALLYEIEPQSKNVSQKYSALPNEQIYSKFDPYSILSNLTANTSRKTLTSEVDGLVFDFSVHGYLPYSLTKSVNTCQTDMEFRKCPICQEFSPFKDNCSDISTTKNILFLDVRNSHLPKIQNIYYPYIFENPDGKYNFHLISPEYSEDGIKTCFSEKEPPKSCLVNTYLKIQKDFYFENGNTSKLIYKNASYDTNEWSPTIVSDTIYFCGRETSEQKTIELYEGIRRIVVTVLDITSMIFLIAMLLDLGTDGMEQLKGLAYKNTLSLSISLLALIIMEELFRRSKCFICVAIYHYFILSYFFWLLISAFNFWSVICLASNKLQSVAGKRYLIRYLIYCVFGWGLPLLIIGVGIYFDLAPASEIPCELKPSYGNRGYYIIAGTLPYYYFYLYPISGTCLSIVILYAVTSYQMCLMKRKSVQSSSHINYYKFFIKLALLTGSTWIIYYVLYIFTENYILIILADGFNACQGVFIFYMHDCKARVVGSFYNKLKGSTSTNTEVSTQFSNIPSL